MSPEMFKWSIWVPVAAFIAMQASMRQTGNMITGYTNEMEPMLFFGWWALLLVVGEILWYILGNPKTSLSLVLDVFFFTFCFASAMLAFYIASAAVLWGFLSRLFLAVLGLICLCLSLYFYSWAGTGWFKSTSEVHLKYACYYT